MNDATNNARGRYAALFTVLLLACALIFAGLLSGCAQKQEEEQLPQEPEYVAELIEGNTLKVLVPLDYAPFSAGSAEEPWGYDVAVAQEIANRMGLQLEFVEAEHEELFSVLTCEPEPASTTSATADPAASSSSTTESPSTAKDPAKTDGSSASTTATDTTSSTSTDSTTSAATAEPIVPEPVADIAIGAFAITPERDEVVDFSSWYFVGDQAVVTLKNATVPKDAKESKGVKDSKATKEAKETKNTINSTADFDREKTRIAVVKGSTCFETAKTLTNEKLIAEYSTAQKCLEALQAKEVQAAVLDLPVAKYLINNGFSDARILEYIMTGEAYGIAIPSGSSHLKDAINEVLAEMEEDGTLARLEEEYLK